MAAILAQSKNILVAAATSVTLSTATTPALTTTVAGNTLIAKCHLKTGGTQSVSSITDSAGNTWGPAEVTAFLSGQNTRTEIWAHPNTFSITSITVTATTSLAIELLFEEWSGAGAPFVSAGAGAAASTTPPAVAVTTAIGQPVSAAISYVNGTAPSALSSPFTAEGGDPSGAWYAANAYHLAATSTSEGPAWTLPASVASGAATITMPLAASDRVHVTTRPMSAAVSRASFW
jgi:hypothetical protein